LVETLINEKLAPSEHEVIWNAEGQSSGLYLVKLVSGQYTQTQKVILLK